MTMPGHLQVSHAEQSVLGAIMLRNTVLDAVMATLNAEDFHHEAHQHIFRAMMTLSGENKPIDFVSLVSLFTLQGNLEEAGGEGYLSEIASSVGITSNPEYYANLVYDAAEVRRLIAVCGEIIAKGQEGDYEEPAALLEQAQQLLFQIGSKRSRQGFTSLSDALLEALLKVQRAYESKSQVTGTPTGFYDLDKKTAGLHGGDLIILAARPAMGKTALALNMGMHAALQQEKPCSVVIFSLEMPTIQLATRILSSESEVESEGLKTGFISEMEVSRLVHTVERLRGSQLFIDDTAGISVVEVRSKCRRLASDPRLPPIGLVIESRRRAKATRARDQ